MSKEIKYTVTVKVGNLGDTISPLTCYWCAKQIGSAICSTSIQNIVSGSTFSVIFCSAKHSSLWVDKYNIACMSEAIYLFRKQAIASEGYGLSPKENTHHLVMPNTGTVRIDPKTFVDLISHCKH